MAKSRWMTRLVRGMMWLAPGAAILGTSCGLTDVRDSVVSAGLAFVEDTTLEVLDAVIPVEAFLNAE